VLFLLDEERKILKGIEVKETKKSNFNAKEIKQYPPKKKWINTV
jgi:hypothetical protein